MRVILPGKGLLFFQLLYLEYAFLSVAYLTVADLARLGLTAHS